VISGELHNHITKLLDIWLPAEMTLLDFSKVKQLAIKLHAIKLEEKFLLWILEFSLFAISMSLVI